MATNAICLITLISGEDLTSYNVGAAVKISAATATKGRVLATAAATDVIIGFLSEKPQGAAGTPVSVSVVGAGGIHEVKLGADVTAGQICVCDATAGRVAGVADIGALAADQMAVGTFLEDGSDGEIIEMLAQVIAAPHTV